MSLFIEDMYEVCIAAAGFNPHVRFMTPYLDAHNDLSSAVFVSLVGFWELEKDAVPPEYFEVFDMRMLNPKLT